MARPQKQRVISPPPAVSLFKPRGVPMAQLETVVLSLDELEALRLADLEGDQHEQAAAKMSISRPTFGRILEHAHKAVAEALLHGKALQIVGGTVTTSRREQVHCRGCRRAWEVPTTATVEFRCPRCAHATGRRNEPVAAEDQREQGTTREPGTTGKRETTHE